MASVNELSDFSKRLFVNTMNWAYKSRIDKFKPDEMEEADKIVFDILNNAEYENVSKGTRLMLCDLKLDEQYNVGLPSMTKFGSHIIVKFFKDYKNFSKGDLLYMIKHEARLPLRNLLGGLFDSGLFERFGLSKDRVDDALNKMDDSRSPIVKTEVMMFNSHLNNINPPNPDESPDEFLQSVLPAESDEIEEFISDLDSADPEIVDVLIQSESKLENDPTESFNIARGFLITKSMFDLGSLFGEGGMFDGFSFSDDFPFPDDFPLSGDGSDLRHATFNLNDDDDDDEEDGFSVDENEDEDS